MHLSAMYLCMHSCVHPCMCLCLCYQSHSCPPQLARMPHAAIMLHTSDAGKTWQRVPLSAKLPGPPINIKALESSGAAEMATESGAIYVTNNTGETWRAAVQETVDATLNRTVSSGISGASYYEGSFASIVRSPQGAYVGVSSRGNFYMTWAPGDTAWTPHNRPATRRLQSLGWTAGEKLWATTRGGDILIADGTGVGAESFSNAKISSRGFGLLDIGCASTAAKAARLLCRRRAALAVREGRAFAARRSAVHLWSCAC